MIARAQEPLLDWHAPYPGVDLMRELGQPRTYRRHTPLFAPGERATHLYLLDEGEVRLSRSTADGRELTLDHLTRGAVFGETEVLLDTPRETLALARTDAQARLLDRGTLDALMAADARVGCWLSRLLSHRQAQLAARLETLLFKSANGRVAQVLVELAQEHGQPTREGTLIDYPITHQEIGNLIATTRETVSYAFMELRQRGLISTRQRRTIVLDLAGLGAMALA
ncbi:MAG: Crp/Fnr family transcriptional regulator [Candidatus Lambdaproteobacteria bacterium]|nr:Crp/Fnr family transcriptional regulator [Candidatus Lambdaproteobacteria bacterium]